MAGREDDHRDGFGESLGHAAERVLGSRALLHGEDANAVAAGHASQRVGHMDAGAFLAHQDGPYTGLGDRLDNAVARIADEIFDAFASQNLGDRRTDLHGIPPETWRLYKDVPASEAKSVFYFEAMIEPNSCQRAPSNRAICSCLIGE